MDVIQSERARQYAIQRLEQELSPDFLYHNIAHTRDDVVPAAERLAEMEGIQGDLRLLLLTAAWFHDLGYIEQPNNHELTSARVASQVLPAFDYTGDQVEIVRMAILATILPQSPHTVLEQILCDADLDVLGRDDFMTSNSNLRRELSHFGRDYDDVQWYASQLKFLESHTYFTASARILRDAGQLKNILALKKRLNEIR